MVDQPQISQKDHSVFWAVVGSIVLAGLLVVGTYYAMQTARMHDIKIKAQSDAVGWAEHLARHTPNLQDIFATGQTTPEQMAALRMAETHGRVTSIALFSPEGELMLSLGPAPTFLSQDERRASVRATTARQTPQVTILEDGGDDPVGGDAGLASIARLPFFDGAGGVIGVAEMKSHHIDTSASLFNVTGLVVVGVPLISAFAFLIPMLTMIRLRRKTILREAELASLARQDGLTGLMNRSGISGKIRPIFANRRDPGEQIGIILIDLDNFKSVNDVFSPAVADAFLCKTAERLLQIVGNSGFVGRMNGDEFMVALPTITREALRKFGRDIQTAIGEPVVIDGHTVLCTASIGMHLSPVGQPTDRALHAADVALNRAVSNGYGQIVEYVDALDQISTRHNQIESYLRRVGFDRAVEVHFQPFVDARTGQIVGFEALARLRSEDGQIIGPDEFIPVAESTGLIHELGMVVLRKAMREARKWPAPIYVSVNLSPVQFQNDALAQDIILQMDRIGLAPERLELELTESLLLSDEEGVSAALKKLRNAGIGIAMDDFGTGYSSLGYLWKYSFDKIKIDKSFLHGHDFEESRYMDIIETIILLGHKLGMSVTVEGVETRRQVEILTQMACDQFQGYYFARPLTDAQALAVVGEVCAPLQKTA